LDGAAASAVRPDQVGIAMTQLLNDRPRTGEEQFTTGQIAEEMLAAASAYARSTIAKMLRRMSGQRSRWPRLRVSGTVSDCQEQSRPG
jgi:hypothetical protein